VDRAGQNDAVIGTLRSIVIDAPDPHRLAEFYAGLAGWTPGVWEDDWVTLTTPDGWRIGIQQVTGLIPPLWPDPKHPQQAHLDLRVPDLEAGAARAMDLGAGLLRRNDTWFTLLDPAAHPFDLCLKADDPRTTLMGVTIDCPDAGELSAFYAELLGKPVTHHADGLAMIGSDGDHPVLFQQVAEYTPPAWPDPAHPAQLHLDVTVTDVDAAERAAFAAGATRLPGEGVNWRVYADPAGKPFCLAWDLD
jgi:catechol 2,3-dioxygenase-like lactoylglutathione lyase family enzyme/predicted enzyme related to lactoylglutathione lyase